VNQPLPPPVLDQRTPSDIYAAALADARAKLTGWSAGFGPSPQYFDRSDVGLVLFKLFADLFGKLITSLNGVPGKYQMAFWDFLGLTLRAPQPAEAPLAVTPAIDAAFALQRGTRVVASSTPGVVFETAEDLNVLPVRVAAAYGLRPGADAYADFTAQAGGQGDPFPLFADTPSQQPLTHALYFSDPTWDFSGQTGELSLTFEGANLYQRFFADWSNGAGATLLPAYATPGYDRLTITFGDLPDLGQGEVNGQSGRWLRTAPAPGVRVVAFQEDALPEIYSVASQVTLRGLAADTALYNSQTVDLKKGGRPFGTAPALQDAFYLSSKAAFSKPQARVTLNFTVQPATPPGPVTLVWEYWNGGGWIAFPVEDGTNNLTVSGAVQFVCPQIISTSVNNTPGSWIRARIAAGGYGSPAGMVVTEPAAEVIDGVLGPYVSDKTGATAALQAQGINFGYVYQPASYAPPFVSALTIDCVAVKRPESILSQNGFEYAPLASRPYTPAPQDSPGFNLGLDAPHYDAEVAGRLLTLFFAPAGAADPDLLPRPGSSVSEGVGAATLQLLYRGANGWSPVTTAPGRRISRAEGVVTIECPRDFVPTTLFGQTLYWLGLQAPAAGGPTPEVGGVYVNVIPAFNAVTQTDTILGSSTGGPSQSFPFPQKPVLEGTDLQVLEPSPPALDPDAEADQAGTTPPAETPDSQTWVRWREVSNFDFSLPRSRHYVIDHDSGVVTFGDGVRGMIPPEGRRNIQAVAWRSGGGPAGNLPAGALDRLQKTDSRVSAVANVLPGVGGIASDQPEALLRLAPGQVRSQDRAVTSADFADLALGASQDVARSTCLDSDLGRITLCILPNVATQTPTPDYGLLSAVQAFVTARMPPLLAPLLKVTGPTYTSIDARVSVIPQPGAARLQVTKAISEAYADFLAPIDGGPAAAGWDFGARVEAASVAEALGGVTGVAFVDGLTLGTDQSAVSLGPDQLPAPGAVTVEFVDADAV
jgi:hypothetical protein